MRSVSHELVMVQQLRSSPSYAFKLWSEVKADGCSAEQAIVARWITAALGHRFFDEMQQILDH